MDKTKKPIFSSKQQIEHLVSKGVKFELMTQAEAEDYLLQNNNYFKLAAYRKNFEKYTEGIKEGQYINLDFAMLKDLAIIDMRLRYTVIHMALDIEHFLKVNLLRMIEKYKEDGYQIVEDYFQKLKDDDLEKSTNMYVNLMNELERNENNPYCGGIIEKYRDGYAVWAFIEVIPLGSLINFYGFCAQRFGDKVMQDYYFLMKDIKEIRNAAAHNNCIIYNMPAKDRKHQVNAAMNKALNQIPKEIRRKRFKNEIMRQLCTLLYAHSNIVTSNGVHEHTATLLNELCNRMFKNEEWYKKNKTILPNFNFFAKAIDILF